jgi:hypothetical protein
MTSENNPSSVRSDLETVRRDYAAPSGLDLILSMRFYKEFTPTALGAYK